MNQKTMTCISLIASVLALTGCVHRPPVAAPESDGSGLPHISIVNVGGALDHQAFIAAVAETRETLHVNMVAREQEKASQFRLLERTAARGTQESRAVLSVYIVNDPEGDDRLACPGRWALMNVRSLGLDADDAEIRQARTTKVVMKAVALACGLGGNPDPRCVLYYKSFSRDGLDGTSASYGPYAHSVLMDTLYSISNGALVPPNE
jgi:hypothetical protein